MSPTNRKTAVGLLAAAILGIFAISSLMTWAAPERRPAARRTAAADPADPAAADAAADPTAADPADDTDAATDPADDPAADTGARPAAAAGGRRPAPTGARTPGQRGGRPAPDAEHHGDHDVGIPPDPNAGVTRDITLQQAHAIVEAAVKKSEEMGKKMDVAVVDAGGNLKAFARMDGAWLGSIDISIRKARTARYFDMNTGDIGALSQPGGPLYNIEHSNGGLITFPGGIPLKAHDGTVIGAIGVSGSTVDDDHKVAEAGAAALGGGGGDNDGGDTDTDATEDAGAKPRPAPRGGTR